MFPEMKLLKYGFEDSQTFGQAKNGIEDTYSKICKIKTDCWIGMNLSFN